MAGKKYAAALSQVDRSKTYDYKEAITLAKKISSTKFDSSMEVSFFLNVDPRQADQNIRGAMVLPNGTGKSQKVLVITQGAKEEEAKNAGADYVGGADMLEKIQGGWFDFDIIVATPDMMGQLGKLGRVLGPKGLMPNPKTGTVEYRVDKDGNVNVMFGKVSFTEEALNENFKALFDQISKVKPNSVKGAYIKKITVSTTMGPGINVTVE